MRYAKRARYIVDRSLQYSALWLVLGIVLAALALHSWITYYRVRDLVDPKVASAAFKRTLIEDAAVALFVSTALAAFVTIRASHRIAGPLYRCAATLRRVRGGDLTPVIKLREGDLLVELADEVNLALASLRELSSEERGHVHEAARLVSLARSGIATPEIQMSLDRALLSLNHVGERIRIDQERRQGVMATAPAPAPQPGPAPPPPGGGPAGSSPSNGDGTDVPTVRAAPPHVAVTPAPTSDKTIALPVPRPLE